MSGHRPGVFKKPAKAHKTWKGHRSKSAIDEANRGRVSVRELTKSRNRSASKSQRRQLSIQNRAVKRKALLEQRRKISAPILTTVLALGGSGSSLDFVNKLALLDDTIVKTEGHNVTYMAIPRFKGRIGFICPDINNTDDILDCLKVSDAVILAWPLNGVLDEWQEVLLSIVKAHGIPTVINVSPGLGSIQSGKKRDEARKAVQSCINKMNLATDKLHNADNESDGLQIMRSIIEIKKKKLLLQKWHSHMLVEKLDLTNENNGTCTLLASGYIRGPSWNVNRLAHIPGLGDFQVSQIVGHPDPHPFKATEHNGAESKVVATAGENVESLQSEIVPNPMDGEQILADEPELLNENILDGKTEKKRVPRGTSSYQAAWILNSDDEGDDEESESEDESNADAEMDGLEPAEESEDEDMEDVPIDDSATEAAETEEDMEIDMGEVEKYRKERENAQFPDEIDTPLDIPARVRFQKYRGMKSFRTSPWDPLENLPYDYARIFKFKNFKRTKKLVLGSIDEEVEGCVDPGTFVTLHVENVPVSFTAQVNPNSPLILYQLLPHEQKMSVVNVVIRKHATCSIPIQSKQKLIFYIGFRKFEAEPIFSQHTNGDKFKMERFMPQDAACVATIFAPITFPPSSVLVFREDQKGRQELVASGSVLDNNPDRIILKRIVLAGHPFKINKRSAVCRYMFFNREDIEWFKPVELYTPSGRRGHIKEPIGTHGHMKVKFDQQLNAQDSVMMSLYKRVYPKWTYNSRVPQLAASRLANS